MKLVERLAQTAEKNHATIVFPEGGDPTVQEAARRLAARGLIQPVLVGGPESSRQQPVGGATGEAPPEAIDPTTSADLPSYVDTYCRDRDMTERVGRRIVSQPLYFAAMMVKSGHAHGLVAGITHATEEVLMACELIIGLEPGIGVASSFFLMEVPGYQGGEAGHLIFADPAVNPDPSAEQLADIALSTARSAEAAFGWQARVAMLSFSTHGSAAHPLVDKVAQATALAHERAPELAIEGEMQADAALVEGVARKKLSGESEVGGRASILIFPELNAANIGAKWVQRLASAAAYGPVLQGFNRPVTDLSRGATVEDVIGAAIMVAARVRRE